MNNQNTRTKNLLNENNVIMSIGETTDLNDLFEYDNLDSFKEDSYQTTTNNDSAEGGIPLSVEILESMKKNDLPYEKGKSQCFLRASEILLKIDSNIKDGPCIIKAEANKKSNIKHYEKPHLPELNIQNDVILLSNRDDCVGLLYDNKLLVPNNTEFNYVLTTRKCIHNIENEYEEQLLEGIRKKYFSKFI